MSWYDAALKLFGAKQSLPNLPPPGPVFFIPSTPVPAIPSAPTTPVTLPPVSQAIPPPPPAVVQVPVIGPTVSDIPALWVMPGSTTYQLGLYRYMIFRLLQGDDPELTAKLLTRVTPTQLQNALNYLRDNQAEAISAPKGDASFFNDEARMGKVLDDLAVWMTELDRRQKTKATGASVLGVEKSTAMILLALLLFVALVGGGYWYMKKQRKVDM